MGNSIQKQTEIQVKQVIKKICLKCNQSVLDSSTFCHRCGSSLKKQKQMNDIERQIQQAKLRQKDIQNSSQDQDQEILDKNQIEKNITNLQKHISKHRWNKDTEQGCWYFGFQFTSDYGQIWSSCDYWNMLVKSNHQLCIDKMKFQRKQKCCRKCQVILQQLQINKLKWEKVVSKQLKLR